MGNLFLFLIAIITIISQTEVDARNYTRKRGSNFPSPPAPRAPRRWATFPSRGQPRGQPQGQTQGQPQGQSRGQPQGQTQGQPQGQSRGQPQGQPRGQPQGQPRGQPQGQPRGPPQGQPQGQPMPAAPAQYDPYRKRELVVDVGGGAPALVPLTEGRSFKRSKSLLAGASSSGSSTPGDFYGRSGNEQFGKKHMSMEELTNALNQKFSYPAAGVSSDPNVPTLQQYLDMGLSYDQIKDKPLSLAERQRLEELNSQLTAPPPLVFNDDDYYAFVTQ